MDNNIRHISFADNELRHIGVIGMKWGSRKSQKKTDKLVKRVDKTIRKFDNGKKGITSATFKEQSREARTETYKINKRIAKMNKYLARTKGEEVNNLIIKFKRNPEKVVKAKKFIAQNENMAKKLTEVRISLMDVKIDAM